MVTVKTNFENFFKIYFPIKFIFLFIYIILLNLFSLEIGHFLTKEYSIFYTVDSSIHYFSCNVNSANILFTLTSCVLNIKSISNLLPILITLTITLIKDLLFIICASKFLNNKGMLIFIILLAVHPYLGIYSLKYSTDIFANLGIAVLFYQMVFNKNGIYMNILSVILVGFRNNLLPVFFVYYLFLLILSIKKSNINEFFKYALLIISIYFITQIGTGSYDTGIFYDFIFTNQNPFSWYKAVEFLGLTHSFMSYVISLPIFLFTHMVLLTGFREAVFVHGFYFLIDLGLAGYLQLIFFILLSCFHIVGTVSFYYYFKNKSYYFFIVLLYIIPTFIALSHLRYFMPIIPIALIGISALIQKKLLKNLR
ncbi:hypothetical protein IDH31_00130 [Pelagibacterales bacterium SAG-MED32]|nr:hypothetical protein [Pelagibacterales bacterium SAG-MED32]